MKIRLALLVSAVLLLAGCGDDESPSANDPAETTDATETPASAPPTKAPTADWPACNAVWRDGKVLPGSYKGCLEGTRAVKAKAVPCEFGKKIVTYSSNFYAAPDFRKGAKLIIHRTEGPVKKSANYRDTFASCTA